MKGQAFMVNVSGKRGYSIPCFSKGNNEFMEDEVIDRVLELGKFQDDQDADYAEVEEMNEYEISHTPKALSLDDGNLYEHDELKTILSVA